MVSAATILVGVGLGVTVGVALTAETRAGLSARGGWAIFLGSLTGLVGTYLALVMVLLVSRIPVVERVLGQDGLIRWHRRLAPWPLSLIAAHALLITIGYAQAARTGALHQLWIFISSYHDMLKAVVALALMLAIGVVSIRAIRVRLRRETWWAVHLGMYLALALAFAHEIALGPSFVGHPLARFVWSAAWFSTAGFVLAYRVGLPLLRSLRHRVQVAAIHREGPDVVSVILVGRRLDRLAVAGGQFFEWRFLARGMWWQAHPFSLSARPQPPYLRMTVKAVGDFTSRLGEIAPGTRVVIEGPYGAFTVHRRRRKKVALIAGGIGVTAVRSLLEDLPKGTDPVVVLRGSDRDSLPLAEEVTELCRQKKGRVHSLVGTRDEVSLEVVPTLVPDIAERDVYVSGSDSFVRAMIERLDRWGVPAELVHYEVYAL